MEVYTGSNYNNKLNTNEILYYNSSMNKCRENYCLSLVFKKSLFNNNMYRRSIIYFDYILPDNNKWEAYDLSQTTIESTLFNVGDKKQLKMKNNNHTRLVDVIKGTEGNTIYISAQKNNCIVYIKLSNNKRKKIGFAILRMITIHDYGNYTTIEPNYYINIKGRGTVDSREKELCNKFNVESTTNLIKIFNNNFYRLIHYQNNTELQNTKMTNNTFTILDNTYTVTDNTQTITDNINSSINNMIDDNNNIDNITNQLELSTSITEHDEFDYNREYKEIEGLELLSNIVSQKLQNRRKNIELRTLRRFCPYRKLLELSK
jgi:hypothetical protein